MTEPELAQARAKPWLIGEHNPYGLNPRRALAPLPPESAGGRLCVNILGMTARDYLRSFERRNLLTSLDKRPAWSASAARMAAAEVLLVSGPAPLVLLGARVAEAFGVPFEPFTTRLCVSAAAGEIAVVLLPHPSGRCRAWNDPSTIGSARSAILTVAPQLADAIGSIER